MLQCSQRTTYTLTTHLKIVTRYINGSVVNLLCTTTFSAATFDYLDSIPKISESRLGLFALTDESLNTVNARMYSIGRNSVMPTMCTPGLIVDQVSASF